MSSFGLMRCGRLLLVLAGLAAAAPAPAAPPVGESARPSGYALTLLIYSTLAALDQANATGNYTVMRDLGSPSFRSMNSAAALAHLFARYREQHVALAPVLLFQPQLVEEPVLDSEGMLRLKGFFPTRPLQINFDLTYQRVEGAWRLMAITIAPTTG